MPKEIFFDNHDILYKCNLDEFIETIWYNRKYFINIPKEISDSFIWAKIQFHKGKLYMRYGFYIPLTYLNKDRIYYELYNIFKYPSFLADKIILFKVKRLRHKLQKLILSNNPMSIFHQDENEFLIIKKLADALDNLSERLGEVINEQFNNGDKD